MVLAAVGCDALSIDLTGDREYTLENPHHAWRQGEGGGAPNPACEADPTENASTVSDECAVFASASAESGGDGTKANPYASLSDAVANAKGKRVLACASGAFEESVAIEAGVEVIGGFDCKAGWTWSEGARSTIEGRAGAAALTLTETASGAKVRSFAIRAANAKDANAEAHATEAGRSSIGVVVADIEAELAQVDVTARDGIDGASGATPTETPQAGASAPAMNASAACSLPGEGARSTIEGRAGAAALTLTETASGAKVRSFAIRAANAKDANAEAHATEAGRSSIGVVVADIEAELAQVDVTARDGIDGASGATPTETPQAGASAPAMNASAACSLPGAVHGGDPGVTTCEDGETRGGAGGPGGITGTDDGNGQNGTDGVPPPEPNPEQDGLGGAGQSGGNCRPGQPGAPGTAGDPGDGGSDTQLTLAGIAGGDGGNGETGKKGQGGGGGGGAKAGLFCEAIPNPIDGPGASGGGGGAGGCGGKGGGGGKAGGSSLGIVSLGTKLVLREVTIAVGKAGKGGDGAGGRGGAAGGSGAAGGAASPLGGSIGCDGGRGGQGGMGGPGAGGRGGHAVGIAYAAAPSGAVELKGFTAGAAGDGGLGGPGVNNAGGVGMTGECWDFAGNASCGQ
ncbi:hypothetical protein SCE1572_04310 [Sorangium cellulosum So0157-2]|uniref:DUF1565 domain-containing protein n=1 Tax=Sorangium cellulosum So0157-2 TaxID=1254432 RepID=S4XT78_SORCE|nr:hypothetical protein SCE1572_04310 [Sorangium cellulosum So0157-2]